MKKEKKPIFLPILTVCIFIGIFVSCGLFFYSHFYKGSLDSANDELIEYIKSHINGQGELVDYTGDIRCNGIDDVRLYVKDGKRVRICYGIITLEWDYYNFVTKKTFDKLELIGITFSCDADGQNLKVYWRGEELERWVW